VAENQWSQWIYCFVTKGEEMGMKSTGFKGLSGKFAVTMSLLFGMYLAGNSAAQAQNRDDRYYGNDIYRVAENNGYRDGVDVGNKDSRAGKSFRPEKSERYENADRGYRRDYGNKDTYKQAYRDGFRRGYEAGYNQNGYRGDYDRNPVYRDDRDRGRDDDDRRYSGGDSYQVARDQGYRDGADQGEKDARNRHRHDPRRTDHYEAGDNGYHGEYGDKEAYKHAYRDGYLRGYEDAYRQSGGAYRRTRR
jgi:hypothetical protein